MHVASKIVRDIRTIILHLPPTPEVPDTPPPNALQPPHACEVVPDTPAWFVLREEETWEAGTNEEDEMVGDEMMAWLASYYASGMVRRVWVVWQMMCDLRRLTLQHASTFYVHQTRYFPPWHCKAACTV